MTSYNNNDAAYDISSTKDEGFSLVYTDITDTLSCTNNVPVVTGIRLVIMTDKTYLH